jgi:hypothetical protein
LSVGDSGIKEEVCRYESADPAEGDCGGRINKIVISDPSKTHHPPPFKMRELRPELLLECAICFTKVVKGHD